MRCDQRSIGSSVADVTLPQMGGQTSSSMLTRILRPILGQRH